MITKDNIRVLNNGFIEVDILPEMFQKAQELADKNFVRTLRTLEKEGNFIGNMGEVVFETVFPDAFRVNNFDFDFQWLGKNIDIKTKSVYSMPEMHYENSIMAYLKQKCDGYVFIRVLNNYTKAWILGSCTKDKYYSKAKLWKKGEVDPDNNFEFKADKYNLPISELKQLGGWYLHQLRCIKNKEKVA